MAKYKYLEFKPRKHSKIFDTRGKLYAYWEKRFKKYANFDYINNPNINPKDSFDYGIITLNKDGSQRKPTESKPLTKKQKESHRKAMKQRSEEIKKLGILKKEVEKSLERELKKRGYNGKISIKFFKKTNE